MRKPFNSIATSSKTHFEDSEEEEGGEGEEIESSSEEEKSDDSIDSDEEEEIERELAEVTFEELRKARADGTDSVSHKPRSDTKHRRANKNRPMELSTKKPMRSFRQVIQAPKKVARDPRFESLCGTLDVDGFRKRYNFLFENNLSAEREEVQKRLKKSKDPKVISELKNHISWIDKQLKFESAKNTDAEILAAHKKKEKEAAKHGKQPFYLKKCNLKFGSKGLLRSIKSSRHLANSNLSLRKREGRMLLRIIDSCPIADRTTASNKVNDSTGFLWLESCIYVVLHLGMV